MPLLGFEQIGERVTLTWEALGPRHRLPPRVRLSRVSREEIGQPIEVERVIGGEAPRPGKPSNVDRKSGRKGRVPAARFCANRCGRRQAGVGQHRSLLLQSAAQGVKNAPTVGVTHWCSKRLVLRSTEFPPEGVSRFTVQGSASPFDEGRFGPVYRSHDSETDQPVLIRTFAQPLAPAEQARLVDALTRLCETPLDHPSIARPLAAGIEEGRPFLVHTLLPGVSLQRFLALHGPQPFADVVLRITKLAAAIDFAAAAGVHHGDLGARDIIVAPEATGISGFGVIQALQEAGIDPGRHAAALADDVRALAGMAFDLLQGRAPDGVRDARSISVPGADTALLRRALEAGLSPDSQIRPATALEFAAALQQAIAEVPPRPVEARDVHRAGSPGGIRDVPHGGIQEVLSGIREALADLPLRPEPNDLTLAADLERTLPLAAALPLTDEGPRLRDDRSADAPAADARRERPAPAPMFSAVPSDRARDPDSHGSGWFLGVAGLAIGILGGFASGYVLGQHGEPLPMPRFAADARRPADTVPARPAPPMGLDGRESGRGARDPGSAQPGPRVRIPEARIESRDLDQTTPAPETVTAAGDPAPASPAASVPGQEPPASTEPTTASTDRRTPDTGSGIPGPESATPAAGAPAARGGVTTPEPGSRATIPGALQVLSRPEGAQVFVDGALVGRTPLVIASVQAGSHDVRIELPGHRRWATSVRVEPGERARVAASLEQ